MYEAVTATFTCAGNEFTAKGKPFSPPGWKEIERRFKASFKTDADEDAPELARELPEITEGQTFDPVEASITEHFTTPPKPYTEDMLLSAMERAGAEDMPEDAERQGLGTPATPRFHSGKAGADGLCGTQRQTATSHQGRPQTLCASCRMC